MPQISGPHDTDELIELLLNDDLPMETTCVRENKYVDWVVVDDLDAFPEKILNVMKENMKEHTMLKALFLKHDEDGSATLDRDEMQTLMEELQFPCKLVEEEFKKIDKDRSGHIDFEEFYEYLSHIAPQVLEHKLWFYVDDDGVEEGPVPQINLEYWINRGQIKEDLKIRREDYEDYHSMGPATSFPEGWLERADIGEDSEASSDEEEQVDLMYVYTAWSACPQEPFEYLRNIRQVEGRLETDRSAVDTLKLKLFKTIEALLSGVSENDKKAIVPIMFPDFVFKNCMQATHLAASSKSVGRAILENDHLSEQFKALTLELEALRNGEDVDEIIEWGVEEDEDNVVGLHPDCVILVARFKAIKEPVNEWMYCLPKGKSGTKIIFPKDQYLPAGTWYPVPHQNSIYGFLIDVFRCPYGNFKFSGNLDIRQHL